MHGKNVNKPSRLFFLSLCRNKTLGLGHERRNTNIQLYFAQFLSWHLCALEIVISDKFCPIGKQDSHTANNTRLVVGLFTVLNVILSLHITSLQANKINLSSFWKSFYIYVACWLPDCSLFCSISYGKFSHSI